MLGFEGVTLLLTFVMVVVMWRRRGVVNGVEGPGKHER